MDKQLILDGLRAAASAALFGIILLTFICITYILPLPWSRFDTLFILALSAQLVLIIYKYEHAREALIIGVFHLLGTCMELFKVSIGSWAYPVDGFFYIQNVPLFAGFMYAAVGSAIARGYRVYKVQLLNAPDSISLLLMSACIYLNFFTHHFIYDVRYFVLAGIFYMCAQTKVCMTIGRRRIEIHFLTIAASLAVLIWCAENIATYTHIWRYPHQSVIWEPVHFEKITSWFLLMLVSFSLVTCMLYPTSPRSKK